MLSDSMITSVQSTPLASAVICAAHRRQVAATIAAALGSNPVSKSS
jgi:predicted regulator of Ras-like GTPase activity (Roadblock/LC7/MglB family)